MKPLYRIIIASVVVLAVSGGLWMYLNDYLSKTKASANIAHITFTKNELFVRAGELARQDITISASSGMSYIDLLFSTEPSTMSSSLSFSYEDTVAKAPPGFEMILDESDATTQYKTVLPVENSPKLLKRLLLISKKSGADLPKAAIIPLYFKVKGTNQTEKSLVTLDLSSSQITGVSEDQISSTEFSLEGEPNPLTFSIQNAFSPAQPVSNLMCNIESNKSKNSCGKETTITWNDAGNEDNYIIYKDGQLVNTLAKDSVSYIDSRCSDFSPHSYTVVSLNADGTLSSSSPKVSCSCEKCIVSPTQQVQPTPTIPLPTLQPTMTPAITLVPTRPQADN